MLGSQRLRQGSRIAAVVVTAALAACATAPPRHSDDLCAVFRQYPDWYDYAKQSEKRWGTPSYVLMAFVRHESGYHADIRPERRWLLGFIPLPRDSSAYGYAQAQDPAWDQYLKDTGGWFKGRADMEDALDFVGWYNHKTHEALGIPYRDAKQLYIAYHEGIGGYQSGAWRRNRRLLRVAASVDYRARAYHAQLRRCEKEFRCDGFFEVWPFCR
jgi:hypothetical protein